MKHSILISLVFLMPFSKAITSEDLPFHIISCSGLFSGSLVVALSETKLSLIVKNKNNKVEMKFSSPTDHCNFSSKHPAIFKCSYVSAQNEAIVLSTKFSKRNTHDTIVFSATVDGAKALRAEYDAEHMNVPEGKASCRIDNEYLLKK